jgi:hypothetical protein
MRGSIRFLLFLRNLDTWADTYLIGEHDVSALVDTAQPNKGMHIPSPVTLAAAHPCIAPHSRTHRATRCDIRPPGRLLAARRPLATSLRSPATSTHPCSSAPRTVPARPWSFYAPGPLRRGSSSSSG